MSMAEERYQKVRLAMEKDGIGVVAAFAKVAKELKVSTATIQASYYKIARRMGTTRALRAQEIRMNARELGESRTDILMRNIVGALTEVVNRNRELEQEADRLHQIEKLLTK